MNKHDSASGYEVALYRDELQAVLVKIAAAHTRRKGCVFPDGWLDAVVCDIADSVERQEICKAAA